LCCDQKVRSEREVRDTKREWLERRRERERTKKKSGVGNKRVVTMKERERHSW
jgi:hypothetical protein